MIADVFRKLLPTGRAYKFGKIGNSFIKGNSDEFDRVLLDIDHFLNGIIPDNIDFDNGWLERFERFYDVTVNPGDSQSVRMARIALLVTPVDPNICLLNIAQIQQEIDNAGWSGVLYIHENPNGFLPQNILPPLTVGVQLNDFQLADEQLGMLPPENDYPEFFSWYQLGGYQLGDAQLIDGPIFNNKIANSLNRYRDTFVNLQPLANTFYICGPNFGDIVTLPASDEIPLRQLLLNIKPASSVGFLLIKYV